MHSIEKAREILFARARPTGIEAVALGDALGRCLADGILADRDFPPTDRSAMDGFAVRSEDCAEPGAALTIADELRAGRAPGSAPVAPGTAVRIMTGSIVPPGADAVVMVELTETDASGTTVRVLEAVEAGQHVRRRAEEARAGDAVLGAGTVIGPAAMAALAAVGADPVRVRRRPTVAVLSTGDEVVEPDAAPAPHQIRNSNARTLLAQLSGLGLTGTYLGIAPDEAGALAVALERGLAHDLVLLTGGVSMGEYDLVGAVLAKLGVETLFHKVAMKPGKPILAATRGDAVVVGLPGNPVSAFTGFAVFVAPFLRRCMGWSVCDPTPVRARLLAPVSCKPGRTTYHLARFAWTDGGATVDPVRTRGSGDVLSLVAADAFAIAPPGRHRLEAGETVEALPWDVPVR